mmetsp:Transcript_12436/g.20208  ORF Transcript_12436/g.20208 Transcript_12436/m.20208 type:complete len:476 (-) Transcript_12436:480-1907(-)
MGGGASKVDTYKMITDRQLTKAHYQLVEGNTPKIKKSKTIAVISASPDSSVRNQNQANCSPNFTPQLRKGQSMVALGSGSTGTGGMPGGKLKKGNSERGMSTGDRRKSDMSSTGGVGTSFQSPLKGKMTMSARLPWLVKEANIPSVSALSRLKYGRIIGRGLMGTVRVCELDTGKFVAVKTISKKYVKKHNDMRHINAERNILKEMTSPFCIRMFGTFQDADNVHMILEYAPGGELFRRITRRDSFPAEVAKFYTAEVFLALDHVHSLGYVFRDLKPENVMLDEYGHCKLIDFGFAITPNDDGLCTTNVGTPAYLSPEQLNGKFTKGYSRIVDWWAFGVFLYELLTSKTPFCNNFSESAFEIYSRVLKGKIKYPGKKFTPQTKDLVSCLLHPDAKRRIVDPRVIEKHAFFADVDWKAVGNRQVIPPFTPRLPTTVIADTQTIDHFDDWGPDPKPPPSGESAVNFKSHMDPDFFNF